MENRRLYEDIARRTEGDIYIGVVGPVRTGKSTFIKRFMETLVIPNIENESWRERAVDELPQSAAGRTIMTTEPKFIPEDAVKINIDDAATMNVRLIDCVGYIVPSSLGYIENEQPRMVVTPWFDQEIPFNMAAEIGTQKVINEHSTIGLVVTTDGSISDIPRSEYEEAEERVITELLEIDKPFIVALNCVEPRSAQSEALRERLEAKYRVPVVAVNCLDLDQNSINEILAKVLYQFPIKEVQIEIPRWTVSLANDHWLKSSIYASIKDAAFGIERMGELAGRMSSLRDCEYITDMTVKNIDFGDGSARVAVMVDPQLFYRVMGESTGLDITCEEDLMPVMIELAAAKKEYDKYRCALEEVDATGYGIVMPTMDQLKLDEPEIIKQGGRYGVRLRATAPSIHIVCSKQKCKILAECGLGVA